METALNSMWGPGTLEGADAIAESVAAKDLNNLYRTSCFFVDQERYKAFCAFYAVMRIVDDAVDHLMAGRTISSAERDEARLNVLAWKQVVSNTLARRPTTPLPLPLQDYPHITELLASFDRATRRFPLPALLWDTFFTAMRRDLEQNRFAAYAEFLRYAEGAAVAPTTIYLYLISAERPAGAGPYIPPPEFDLMGCGRELGRFAYLAHILRDLAQDLDQGLLYLAADDMARHAVTEEMLHACRMTGYASPQIRALAGDLIERARGHLERGCSELDVLNRCLEPDRGFILQLIVRIYERILDKIAMCSYDIMGDRHRLTSAEKEAIAFELTAKIGLATS
jgi:phytoene synthase